MVPRTEHQALTDDREARWALALLSLLSAEQNIIWLTYGCIPDSAADYYHVDKYWILNVFPALGGFIYLPMAVITSWAVDRLSIVLVLKIGAVVIAAAACLRLQGSFVAVLAAQSLNAMTGPIVMTAPPRIR